MKDIYNATKRELNQLGTGELLISLMSPTTRKLTADYIRKMLSKLQIEDYKKMTVCSSYMHQILLKRQLVPMEKYTTK